MQHIRIAGRRAGVFQCFQRSQQTLLHRSPVLCSGTGSAAGSGKISAGLLQLCLKPGLQAGSIRPDLSQLLFQGTPLCVGLVFGRAQRRFQIRPGLGVVCLKLGKLVFILGLRFDRGRLLPRQFRFQLVTGAGGLLPGGLQICSQTGAGCVGIGPHPVEFRLKGADPRLGLGLADLHLRQNPGQPLGQFVSFPRLRAGGFQRGKRLFQLAVQLRLGSLGGGQKG